MGNQLPTIGKGKSMSDPVEIALIAAVQTLCTAFVGALIHRLTLHINSKMDNLLELTAKSSMAEGIKAEGDRRDTEIRVREERSRLRKGN